MGSDSLVELQPQVAVRGIARCPSYYALVELRWLIWGKCATNHSTEAVIL